jgi:hypothetical protein
VIVLDTNVIFELMRVKASRALRVTICKRLFFQVSESIPPPARAGIRRFFSGLSRAIWLRGHAQFLF